MNGVRVKYVFPASFLLWAVFCFSCTPVQPGTGAAKKPLIYIVSDIHYLSQSLYDDGPLFQRILEEGDGKNIKAMDTILDALLFAVENRKPDILLASGDLTFNGEEQSHRELAAWFSRFEAAGTKVFVIPGNHDIDNPWARKYSGDQHSPVKSVSYREFRSIYRDFGYKEAVSEDRKSLSYIAEPVPGLRLLMLDSCKYRDNKKRNVSQSSGSLSQETLRWIKTGTEKTRKDGALLVTAMHHSLMSHNAMMNGVFTVDDSGMVMEYFAALGINFVLSGHIHAQDIGEEESFNGPVFDIAGNALSVYPHSYGTLELQDNADTLAWHYRMKKTDAAAWAKAQGIQDPGLLNFNDTSREFFFRRAQKITGRFTGDMDPPLPESDVKRLSEIVGILNMRYFAGEEFLNQEDRIHWEALQILEKTSRTRLNIYIENIMNDEPPANQEILIPVYR